VHARIGGLSFHPAAVAQTADAGGATAVLGQVYIDTRIDLVGDDKPRW